MAGIINVTEKENYIYRISDASLSLKQVQQDIWKPELI